MDAVGGAAPPPPPRPEGTLSSCTWAPAPSACHLELGGGASATNAAFRDSTAQCVWVGVGGRSLQICGRGARKAMGLIWRAHEGTPGLAGLGAAGRLAGAWAGGGGHR